MVCPSDVAQARILQLEQLISNVRHDVNGALTPALLMADRLRGDDNPRVQRAGETIGQAIVKVTKLLKATRDIVPPKQSIPLLTRSESD
jgi:hypothetical protein